MDWINNDVATVVKFIVLRSEKVCKVVVDPIGSNGFSVVVGFPVVI